MNRPRSWPTRRRPRRPSSPPALPVGWAPANGQLASPPSPQSVPPEPYVAGAGILTLQEEERRAIARALELTAWNLDEAAQRLGLSREEICRKLESHWIGSFGGHGSH